MDSHDRQQPTRNGLSLLSGTLRWWEVELPAFCGFADVTPTNDLLVRVDVKRIRTVARDGLKDVLFPTLHVARRNVLAAKVELARQARGIAGLVQVSSDDGVPCLFKFSLSIPDQLLCGGDERHHEHCAASLQAEK